MMINSSHAATTRDRATQANLELCCHESATLSSLHLHPAQSSSPGRDIQTQVTRYCTTYCLSYRRGGKWFIFLNFAAISLSPPPVICLCNIAGCFLFYSFWSFGSDRSSPDCRNTMTRVTQDLARSADVLVLRRSFGFLQHWSKFFGVEWAAVRNFGGTPWHRVYLCAGNVSPFP